MSLPLQRPDGADALEAIDLNLVGHLCLVEAFPGALVRRTPELTWHTSGVADGFFNGASLAQLEPARVGATSATLAREFAERGLGLVWRVGHASAPADLGERLLLAGFEDLGTLRGMSVALDGLGPKRGPRHAPGKPAAPEQINPAARDRIIAAVEVTEVTDPGRMGEYIGVIAAAATHPLPPGPPPIVDVYNAIGFGGPAHHHLLQVDGVSAAVATAVDAAGVVGVYHVHTLPGWRRRGLGTAVTLHALLAARRRGMRVGVLQATEAAVGMYLRMGFVERSRMRLLGAGGGTAG